MKKIIYLLLVSSGFYEMAQAQQKVGINVTSPTEVLHVDSTVKIGKNVSISSSTPGRKNLLKFGDESYVTIGEEQGDDKLYIRYGDLIFNQSNGSVGNGYIGIKTETPTAALDINGTLRLRSGTPAAGKVLTSDASGNATWQAPTTTANVGFRAYLTSDISRPAGSFSLVNFTEDFDDGFNFNAVTGIFTAPSAGVYHFTTNAGWNSAPAGSTIYYTTRIVIEFAGGGSDFIVQNGFPVTNISGYGNNFICSGDYKLGVGDKVHVDVSHNYSSNVSLSSNGSSQTTFSGFKVY